MKIKKIVASALLLCMVASLTACGSKEKTPEEAITIHQKVYHRKNQVK